MSILHSVDPVDWNIEDGADIDRGPFKLPSFCSRQKQHTLINGQRQSSITNLKGLFATRRGHRHSLNDRKSAVSHTNLPFVSTSLFFNVHLGDDHLLNMIESLVVVKAALFPTPSFQCSFGPQLHEGYFRYLMIVEVRSRPGKRYKAQCLLNAFRMISTRSGENTI